MPTPIHYQDNDTPHQEAVRSMQAALRAANPQQDSPDEFQRCLYRAERHLNSAQISDNPSHAGVLKRHAVIDLRSAITRHNACPRPAYDGTVSKARELVDAIALL